MGLKPILRQLPLILYTGGGCMKKQALTLVAMLSLLLAAGSAFAQTIHVKANIPFNFIVGQRALMAGVYTIDSLSLASGSRILLIGGEDGKDKIMVNANSAESLEASGQTKLVFRRYEGRYWYFLAEIWVAGEKFGHRLPKSAREAEVAMDYNPQQVVVLAQLR
jgi:hypothetical protein